MNNSGFSKITAELNYVYDIANVFPIEVWDLSKIDNREGTFVNIEEAISITSFEDFESRLIELLNGDQIVVVTNMVQSAYYKFYRILKKYNIPVIDTQKNNFMKYLEQKAGLSMHINMPLKTRLKRILNNIEIVRAVNKKIKYNGVKFDYLVSAYNFAPEEVINYTKTHNVKYDEYLKYKDTESPLNFKYILFIDSATCYHPADYRDDANFDEAHHLSQLNSYFDIVEKETGLPVVISLHPCSVNHLTNESFHGRRCVYSQTSLYIQHAEFVISFFSTSLINVILAHKPSIIISSKEILSSKRRTQQECAFAFAEMCKLKTDSLDNPMFSIPVVDEAKYTWFIDTYLVNRDREDCSNAQMVIDLIKSLKK